MEVKRSGTQPSTEGPPQYFTGQVRIDPFFESVSPARVAAVSVTFQPGARTAWHTHPLGQKLIVTAGCGLVQSWGSPITMIRPGDVVLWRRGAMSPGREALARRDGEERHDPHRHPRGARWKNGGVDGTGQRRGIQSWL